MPAILVWRTLNNLAFLYRAQGRYTETELLYKITLEIREKARGLDHAEWLFTYDVTAVPV